MNEPAPELVAAPDVDRCRDNIASGLWRFSNRCDEVVAVVRWLAETEGMSGSRIAERLKSSNRPITRNAVSGLAYRAKITLKGYDVSPRSPGMRAKVSAALTGRKASPETRAKLSAAMKGNVHRAKDKAAALARRAKSGRYSPQNASTRYAGLERAMQQAHAPIEQPCVSLQSPSSSWVCTPKLSRNFPARCTWHGCSEPPIAAGKPYCSAHHTQSGALIAARPLVGARSQ